MRVPAVHDDPPESTEMPLYEYRCRACAHQFEIQQSFADDALTVCPECGGDLRKVFTPVGITFKGSGFYKNDSRGASSSTETSSTSGSGDAGSSSGSDSGSGDSSSKKDSSSTPSTSSSTSGSD